MFLIAVNICIILIYNSLSEKSFIVQQYSIIKEQNKYHEDTIDQQYALIQMKHDLKNILINLDLYLQDEKIDKARSQLQSLIDTSSLTNDIRTGNIPIDAILNKKLNQIKHLNIKNTFNLQIPIELNTDEIATDLAAILGNLMDNAIEATLRSHNSMEKEIKVDIKYSDEKLYIHIANKSNELNQDFSKKIVKSEKERNRNGIGISSVKERVDRLKGYHDFKYESGFFKVFVVLPISILIHQNQNK